ncbi:GTP-binding protein [Cellvibrio sp. UBA7671]|uniref:GTP-binding protein n=1 Tax=Cellvibrio sp. UBA7671 TaxID=1946312 RepID=UPI002F3587C6
MAELKIVITGTPGVGKTTALSTVSDRPPVTTEEATSDGLAKIKDTTTVAFDFGEVLLDDGTQLRIYGTPGQIRFRHMWDIVAQGALGFIILIDITRDDPLEDLAIYIENFEQSIRATSAVIGVTRTTNADLEPFYNYLERKNLLLPIMFVDPRDKDDMVDLLMALIAMLEYAE